RPSKPDRTDLSSGKAGIREVNSSIAAPAGSVHLDRSLVVELAQQIRGLRAFCDGPRVREIACIVGRSAGRTVGVLVASHPDVTVGLLERRLRSGRFRAKVGVALCIPGDDGITRARRIDLRPMRGWRRVAGIPWHVAIHPGLPTVL